MCSGQKNHRPARSDTLRTVPSPLTKNGELIVSRASLRRDLRLVEAVRPCVVWRDIEEDSDSASDVEAVDAETFAAKAQGTEIGRARSTANL